MRKHFRIHKALPQLAVMLMVVAVFLSSAGCGNQGLNSTDQTPTLSPLPIQSPASEVNDVAISEWQEDPSSGAIALVVERRPPAESTGSGQVEIHIGPGSRPLIIPNSAEPAWSPAGSVLAYVRHTDRVIDYPDATGVTRDVLDWAEPRERRVEVYSLHDGTTVAITADHEYMLPAWSRDGAAIAFVRSYVDSEGIGRQLSMSRKPFDEAVESLATGERVISRPQWSPSGDEIAYLAWQTIDRQDQVWHRRDLHVKKLADSAEQRLTSGDPVAWFSWSPDGQQIAFTTAKNSRHEMGAIQIVDPDTQKMQTLLLGADGAVIEGLSWSPDGLWLALGVTSVTSPTQCNIAVVELANGQVQWLTQHGKARLPRWSSDGESVLYVHDDREIWQMKSDGTEPQRLLSAAGFD